MAVVAVVAAVVAGSVPTGVAALAKAAGQRALENEAATVQPQGTASLMHFLECGRLQPCPELAGVAAAAEIVHVLVLTMPLDFAARFSKDLHAERSWDLLMKLRCAEDGGVVGGAIAELVAAGALVATVARKLAASSARLFVRLLAGRRRFRLCCLCGSRLAVGAASCGLGAAAVAHRGDLTVLITR